jgi:hypothetical protein
MSALTLHWDELVTVALLGTDRRDPPPLPPGPVADLVADASAGRAPTPGEVLRTQVAALAVARRAGLQPAPPIASLAPPTDDPRPTTSPELTGLWVRMARDWPVLDDEVQLAIASSGRRTAPDLLVAALGRARTDAARHARVVRAGGALARWLLDLQPHLRPAAAKPIAADVVERLPDLPVPPDLLALATESPDRFAHHLRAEFDAGRFGPPHRAVLVNLLARVPPAALVPAARALHRTDPSRTNVGLAMALADLAALRHHLLTELEPPPR